MDVTRTSGHQYLNELSQWDHERLAQLLHTIKGTALISGYDCDLYQRLYYGWHAVSKTTQTQGKPATEMLWMHPKAASWWYVEGDEMPATLAKVPNV